MKYRKRPIIIEAWQWLFTIVQETPPVWIQDAMDRWPNPGCSILLEDGSAAEGPRILVSTLEGVMTAHTGDWIIQGVKGELYPVRNDIFCATYEPVEG